MLPHHSYKGMAWNPSTGYWEYVRTQRPTPGMCERQHCRKPVEREQICPRCRKRLSRLNNPWAARRNDIARRAKSRGQEFNLTTAQLKAAVIKAGLEVAFITDPNLVHIDRKDALKGYTKENIQALTQDQNLAKSANDKRRHAYAKLKQEGQIDRPF